MTIVKVGPQFWLLKCHLSNVHVETRCLLITPMFELFGYDELVFNDIVFNHDLTYCFYTFVIFFLCVRWD